MNNTDSKVNPSEGPVEVRGDDRTEGSEDDHNGDADFEETPGVFLDSSEGHHLSPVEPWVDSF